MKGFFEVNECGLLFVMFRGIWLSYMDALLFIVICKAMEKGGLIAE